MLPSQVFYFFSSLQLPNKEIIKMAVLLLKFIFMAITTLSNLISRLVFTLTARLIVLALQACRVPGQAILRGLERVSGFIKTCLEYFLVFMLEAMSSLVSTAFDLIKEGVLGSAAVTASAIGGLVEKTRDSLSGLLEDFPEVYEGLWEMVSTSVTVVWNNYMDAIGYVKENA